MPRFKTTDVADAETELGRPGFGFLAWLSTVGKGEKSDEATKNGLNKQCNIYRIVHLCRFKHTVFMSTSIP